MTAYYNEFDPFAAAWLMQLIGAGHIAPGVVDTRDLWDVTPNDLVGFTQVHFCAGIGVWSYALRRAGWPDDRPVWTASFPCQPFSAAGQGRGFADERHLWPAGLHLIEQCDPAVVLGEQVASKDGLAWLDLVRADLEGTGRTFAAADLCAAGVGAPHIRQRSFWMAYANDQQSGQRRKINVQRGWSNHAKQNEVGRVFDRLGDDDDARLEGHDRHGDQRDQPGRLDAQPAGSGRAAGGIGGVADPDGRNARTERQSPGGQHGQQPQDGGFAGPWKSYADWFGVCWHPACRDSERNYCDCNSRGAPNGWEWDIDDGWVEVAAAVGLERRTIAEREQQARGRGLLSDGAGDDANATGPAGPTNGFWRDADWLFCRDGKWRPVEPGTFPLAHGATNRVGRLRGYGNAIVAPVAETFIRSVMECV